MARAGWLTLVLFIRCRVWVVHIRGRTHGNQHTLAIWRELYIARPMSPAMRQVDDVHCLPSHLQISILIRKPHHCVSVSHVHPLKVWSWRIKRDPLRAIQSCRKNCGLPRFTVGCNSAKHSDLPAATFCHEDVAIGRSPNQSRIIQSCREPLHGKARRSFWLAPFSPAQEPDVVSLKGVAIFGFRMVRVPRVWDDPACREAERGAHVEIGWLARTFKITLDEWTQSVSELATWIRHSLPPLGAKQIEPWFEDQSEDDDDGGPETIQ